MAVTATIATVSTASRLRCWNLKILVVQSAKGLSFNSVRILECLNWGELISYNIVVLLFSPIVITVASNGVKTVHAQSGLSHSASVPYHILRQVASSRRLIAPQRSLLSHPKAHFHLKSSLSLSVPPQLLPAM